MVVKTNDNATDRKGTEVGRKIKLWHISDHLGLSCVEQQVIRLMRRRFIKKGKFMVSGISNMKIGSDRIGYKVLQTRD